MIQTALTTAVDLVGTQRHLWVSLLGLAIAVGSSNGVTSLGTDLRTSSPSWQPQLWLRTPAQACKSATSQLQLTS